MEVKLRIGPPGKGLVSMELKLGIGLGPMEVKLRIGPGERVCTNGSKLRK